MTRFLTFVAVAMVAGAMYVAAAPGGLHSAGPTQAQFKALKAHVANLQKLVGQVKKESDAGAVVLARLPLLVYGAAGTGKGIARGGARRGRPSLREGLGEVEGAGRGAVLERVGGNASEIRATPDRTRIGTRGRTAPGR